MQTQRGVTLIELMVVVGVLAIIAAIGIPMYAGYIETAREGALINEIATIEVFQEDFRLRTGNYQPGVFNGAPDADLLQLGWEPQDDDGSTYTITVAGNSYDVTATDSSGTSVCRRFPAKVPCP